MFPILHPRLTTNQRLKADYKYSLLSRKAFAEQLGVPVETLKAWLRPTSNVGFRKAPEIAAKWADYMWSPPV